MKSSGLRGFISDPQQLRALTLFRHQFHPIPRFLKGLERAENASLAKFEGGAKAWFPAQSGSGLAPTEVRAGGLQGHRVGSR